MSANTIEQKENAGALPKGPSTPPHNEDSGVIRTAWPEGKYSKISTTETASSN